MLSIERIALIAILKQEFNLSNETVTTLEYLVERRLNAIERNCLVDKSRISINEIYLGTLLYLQPEIEITLIEQFLKRIYSRDEVERITPGIVRYPEWLAKSNTANVSQGSYESVALKML
jgi:hypothetical protein